jgi:hypothetical protein
VIYGIKKREKMGKYPEIQRPNYEKERKEIEIKK